MLGGRVGIDMKRGGRRSRIPAMATGIANRIWTIEEIVKSAG